MFPLRRFDAPDVRPISNAPIAWSPASRRITLKNAINCPRFPCEKITDLLRRSEKYEEKCKAVCTDEEYRMLKSAFFHKEENLQK